MDILQSFSLKNKMAGKFPLKEWINCDRRNLPEVVLVQDDEQNRGIWRKAAQKLGIRLAIYAVPEKFLDDIDLFDDHTQFYFEFYLGDGHLHGLDLAHHVKSKLKAEVFLITSLPKRSFSHEIEIGIINNVFGRNPWPFTPENSLPLSNDSNLIAPTNH